MQDDQADEKKEARRAQAKKAAAASANYWRGRKRSEEQKAAHSSFMRGRIPYNKGIPKPIDEVERSKKHGHASDKGKLSPTYISWRGMKQRCLDPNKDSYKHYGGRGITVSPRWLGPEGFQNFLADMGERPDGLTLDRANTDGPYSPENCRWADKRTQARNIRKAKLSEEDVAWIRDNPQVSSRAAGEKYGVSKTVVLDVRKYKGRYAE